MKLTKIILEQDDLFVPRRSQEERNKNRITQLKRKLQAYIKTPEGPLDLSDLPEPLEFPSELTEIGGDLNITNTTIAGALPEGLIVDGDLLMSECRIDELPPHLHVVGDLYAIKCNLRGLPQGLRVQGNLDLSYCRDLKEIPYDIEVDGFLSIRHTDVPTLPEGTVIKGSIYAQYSRMETLPEDLIVYGDLNLTSTWVTKIDTRLTVNGTLTLSDTKVRFISSTTKARLLRIDNTPLVKKFVDERGAFLQDIFEKQLPFVNAVALQK